MNGDEKKRSDRRSASRRASGAAVELGPLFDAERDVDRTVAVDMLLSTVDDRNWNPDDPGVLDLSQSFDVLRQPIMPEKWFPELRSKAASGLTASERIRLGNEIVRWFLSGILHGEQTAFYICAQLCMSLDDAAAREFVANQAREEARHARAFTNYLTKRWGPPYPPSSVFGQLLRHLHKSARVDRKIVGMSFLIEGFAMGALSNIRAHTNDPVLERVLGHVLRDETVHHNFGAVWLNEVRGSYSRRDWRELQRFTQRGYQALCLNLVSIHQRRDIYGQFGLDWKGVRDAVRVNRRSRERATGLEEDINPLTVLARNLERANLIPTKRSPGYGVASSPMSRVEASTDQS